MEIEYAFRNATQVLCGDQNTYFLFFHFVGLRSSHARSRGVCALIVQCNIMMHLTLRPRANVETLFPSNVSRKWLNDQTFCKERSQVVQTSGYSAVYTTKSCFSDGRTKRQRFPMKNRGREAKNGFEFAEKAFLLLQQCSLG